jgi:lactobin A/cerein 7B family class IIb bacteriocin
MAARIALEGPATAGGSVSYYEGGKNMDLQPVSVSELQEVEGGCLPLLIGVAIVAAVLLYAPPAN